MMHTNRLGYIYKIINPTGKVYIGKTTDLKTRLLKYKYSNCKNQKRLYSSLLKYGWENHIVEIVEIIIIYKDNLDILERYHIQENNSFIKGLNCTLGGDGTSGINYSLESRTKMRNSQLGKKQSKETIDKRVLSLKGKKRSQSFRDNQKLNRLNAVVSKETREKLRNINLGNPSPNRIKCRLLNLLTKEVWEGESLLELSKVSPLSIAAIGRLKSGKSGKRVTKIYKFEYDN